MTLAPVKRARARSSRVTAGHLLRRSQVRHGDDDGRKCLCVCARPMRDL